jgi:hypothetical protein
MKSAISGASGALAASTGSGVVLPSSFGDSTIGRASSLAGDDGDVSVPGILATSGSVFSGLSARMPIFGSSAKRLIRR